MAQTFRSPAVSAAPAQSKAIFASVTNGPAPYVREPGENIQCPSCLKYNSGDAHFCDQCGAKLPAEAFAAAATPPAG
jgi:hypothetical protein